MFQLSNADLNNLNENEVLDISITYTNFNDMKPHSLHNDVDYDENGFDLDASITNADLLNEFNPPIANISELTDNAVLDANNYDDVLDQGDYNNDVLDLRISIPYIDSGNAPVAMSPQVTPIQDAITPPTSTSSGKNSIQEILNSIVRFKEKGMLPEKKKKIRKKLHLPAVMTSQGWIDLKRASEREKADAENAKKERKKRIESARKVRNPFALI